MSKATHTSASGLYATVRTKLEAQLAAIAARIDEALDCGLEAGNMVKTLANAQKDLLNCYNEATRLEKVVAVDEGRMVPIEVIATYQDEVMPEVVAAQDNMRTRLLDALPKDMRPAVEDAWQQVYHVYVDKVQRAGQRLDEYVQAVQEQARGEMVHTNLRNKGVLTAKRAKK